MGLSQLMVMDVVVDETHVGAGGADGSRHAKVVNGSEYGLSPLKLRALCLKE